MQLLSYKNKHIFIQKPSKIIAKQNV